MRASANFPWKDTWEKKSLWERRTNFPVLGVWPELGTSSRSTQEGPPLHSISIPEQLTPHSVHPSSFGQLWGLCSRQRGGAERTPRFSLCAGLLSP